MTKRNQHVGGSLADYIAKRDAREAGFAAGVQVEFDSLQLARRVRATREELGLTQADLAERAHTTQSAIARLESGRVMPRLDLLSKLAAAFGAELIVDFKLSRRRT
jgi:DNA-binding XRE family transcriptional regulator